MKLTHVPWYDWNEWYLVYHHLFDHDPQKQLIGVQRVRVWIARNDTIPHAVECTVNLMVHLSSCDPIIQQHGIGMCIVRMVNGYKLQQQKKQSNPKDEYFVSVRDAMIEINMPQEITEVRHAMSHKHLPSLSRLKHTGRMALDWLKENYWDKQHNLLSVYHTSLLTRINEYGPKSKDPIVKLLNANLYDLIMDVVISILFDVNEKNRMENIKKKRLSKLEPMNVMLKDVYRGQFLSKLLLSLFSVIQSVSCGKQVIIADMLVIDESRVELTILWMREILQHHQQELTDTCKIIQDKCKLQWNKL
jgi:hypothetical protein